MRVTRWNPIAELAAIERSVDTVLSGVFGPAPRWPHAAEAAWRDLYIGTVGAGSARSGATTVGAWPRSGADRLPQLLAQAHVTTTES